MPGGFPSSSFSSGFAIWVATPSVPAPTYSSVSGSYTTLTLQQAMQALADRLSDTSMIRWVAAELQSHILESLRTYSALTATFRDRGVFPTVASQAFYDLPTVLPALRGYTVTDADLIASLEYSLLEPLSSGASWSGSQQFSLADLVNALTRRRDQFLRDTGAVVTRILSPVSPPPDGRIPLSQSVISLRRLAWMASGGTYSPLRRDDAWGIVHYRPRWVQTPTRPPAVYSVSDTPPLWVQLAPPPLDAGTLDLLAIDSLAAVSPIQPALAAPLNIPDDWTWVVKFGALADLFSRDGLAKDAARAVYCEQRYQDGVERATAAPVILSARIDDGPAPLHSIADLDRYLPGWQANLGQPTKVLSTGQNLLALSPVPDAAAPMGQYAITVDLVRNAPIPTALNHFLAIGPELVDALLDYAQHLALLKEGAQPLLESQHLLDRFARACGVTMNLQQASVPARRQLSAQTLQDVAVNPRQQAALPLGTQQDAEAQAVLQGGR